jgi:hypothetical protein
MRVDVSVYGSLARFLGGKHVSTRRIQLPEHAKVQDLYTLLNIPPEETSYVFINAVLADMPGYQAALEEKLHDGDHIGIFSLGYIWPYQYRDGAMMTSSLLAALDEHIPLHHDTRYMNH